MVYTDGVHLIADSIDELHEFAHDIGLKRCWFQNHRHKHYDLTTQRKVLIAIEAGALSVSTRDCMLLSLETMNRLISDGD